MKTSRRKFLRNGLLFVPAASALAQIPPRVMQDYFLASVPAPSAGVEYLLTEDCEGTGTPSGWSDSGTGTVDWDYTTSPIAGSHSVLFSTSAQTAFSSNSLAAGISAMYCFFRLRIDSGSGAFAFIRTSTTTQATILISSGKLSVSASGGTSNNSAGDIPTGENLYIWFEYLKGTGSDAIARAGWSTDGTKPTFSAGGATSCVSSNGTATNDVTMLRLGNTSSSTFALVFDTIRVAASAIGSNPT